MNIAILEMESERGFNGNELLYLLQIPMKMIFKKSSRKQSQRSPQIMSPVAKIKKMAGIQNHKIQMLIS